MSVTSTQGNTYGLATVRRWRVSFPEPMSPMPARSSAGSLRVMPQLFYQHMSSWASIPVSNCLWVSNNGAHIPVLSPVRINVSMHRESGLHISGSNLRIWSWLPWNLCWTQRCLRCWRKALTSWTPPARASCSTSSIALSGTQVLLEALCGARPFKRWQLQSTSAAAEG